MAASQYVTVDKLISWLTQFPGDAVAYAYEGENGPVIVVVNGVDLPMTERKELGMINTEEA